MNFLQTFYSHDKDSLSRKVQYAEFDHLKQLLVVEGTFTTDRQMQDRVWNRWLSTLYFGVFKCICNQAICHFISNNNTSIRQ